MSKSNTVVKPLPRAWSVGGQKVNEVELREPTVKDTIEAEKDGNPIYAPNAYRAALAAQTMVRAGTFTGPFTPAQFHGMGVANWRVIEVALMEAETLGEDEQPSQSSQN